MAELADEEELARRATSGDQEALERLLVGQYDRLAAEVARQLPDDLRGAVSADDVLQETFIVAFREIGHFTPTGPDSLSYREGHAVQNPRFLLPRNSSFS